MFHAPDGLTREVMGTHKERIDMEYLGTRRLVIGIVQSHQRVPQEGRELTAGGFQLCRRVRLLDHLREVRVHLDLGMPLTVNTRRPLSFLALAENAAWHLKFPQTASHL